MRALKFIVFDIKNGCLHNWRRYLASLVVFSLITIIFCLSAKRGIPHVCVPLETLSLGDCLIAETAGMEEYIFDPTSPFEFPATWMLVYLLVSYITLDYPFRDLSGIGKHLMVISGSRLSWWSSKCIWVVVSVLMYFMLAFIAAAVLVFICKGSYCLVISPSTPVILDFNEFVLKPLEWDAFGFLLAVPVVTVSVCLVQLTLSLLFGPILSYIFTVAALFVASYFQSPLLLGNYLMAARSSCFVVSGVSWQVGIALAFLVSSLAVVAGGLVFRGYDVLHWES